MTSRVDDAIERAAADLRATSRAFTRGNLYHAVLRVRPELRNVLSLQRFHDVALARRLKRGAVAGLLPAGAARSTSKSAAPVLAHRELEAYFPAAILLVDRPAIVDLFVASGALVQTRIAVVCVDGSPTHVVAWLRRAIRAGHRAPVGYLHDARTVLYPFLYEPLATLSRLSAGQPIAYRDLGIGPGSPLRDPMHLGVRPARARFLEELPPCSLVAHASQHLLRMLPADPLLAPTRPELVETA